MVRPSHKLYLNNQNLPQTSRNLDSCQPALSYEKSWQSIIDAYRENAVKWVVNGIMSCFPHLQHDDPRIYHLYNFAKDLENRILNNATDLADYFNLININVRMLKDDFQRQEFLRFQQKIMEGG